MWFRDYKFLTAKCEQLFKEVREIPILRKVNIVKDYCSYEIHEEGSRFNGEPIICHNGIIFYVNLNVGTYYYGEHISLVQKITKTFMLNHQLRGDVETFHFENKCNRQQRSLLIECLIYMNHDNVNKVFPDNDDFIRNIRKIYGLCNRHGAKIKLELYSEHSDTVEDFVHITNPGNVPFSINKLITPYKLTIRHSKAFLECIKGFQIYENPEVLDIRLY
uniref:Helitron_like_N domain-containing protein n=1 Tax=Strongyloides venezuelensis TaxID=75913 RepID=A0A0K0F8N7_STRVS